MLTSGTGPLRLVAFIGLLSVFVAVVLTAYTVWGKLTARVDVPGWASLLIVVSLFSGLILFSLGVLAEYLGVRITMALGKPLYLIEFAPQPRRPAAMNGPLIWVVGGGGLLGSHMGEALRRHLPEAQLAIDLGPLFLGRPDAP